MRAVLKKPIRSRELAAAILPLLGHSYALTVDGEGRSPRPGTPSKTGKSRLFRRHECRTVIDSEFQVSRHAQPAGTSIE